MPKRKDIDLHVSRYKAMLDFQETIKPFTPTVRDLVRVWSVNSTNTALGILIGLSRAGLCVTRENGSHTSFYAIKIKNPSMALREAFHE